jgi:hypothetical protein
VSEGIKEERGYQTIRKRIVGIIGKEEMSQLTSGGGDLKKKPTTIKQLIRIRLWFTCADLDFRKRRDSFRHDSIPPF